MVNIKTNIKKLLVLINKFQPTFLFSPLRFIYSRCYGHGELMGVSTESQKQFAFVIAPTIEGELVRLVDCAYLKLLALCINAINQKNFFINQFV